MKLDEIGNWNIQSVIDNLPIYIFWKDSNSIFMGGNKNFLDFVGVSNLNDLIGKTDFDFDLEEYAQKTIKSDKYVIEKKKPVLSSIETHKNKKFKVDRYPILDEKKQLKGIICTMIYIPDQIINAKDYIIENENKYKMPIENLSEGILVVDQNHNIIFVNEIMCNMLKYEKKELTGLKLSTIINEDNIIGCMKLIDKLDKNIDFKKQQHETTMVKKDKSDLNVMVQCSSFFDKKNDFKGIIASVLDISERKSYEESIKNKDETYKSVIEFTDTAFLVLNEELKIIQTNNTFCKIINGEMDNIIGRNPRSWVHCDDIKIFDKCFTDVLNEKPIKELELRLNIKNKTIYSVINANIMKNGTNKIICLMRDISYKRELDRKRYIEEQKKKDTIKQKISELRIRLKETHEKGCDFQTEQTVENN